MRKRGRKRKYPWRRWLKPEAVLTLCYGADFVCSPEAMEQQVRSAASVLGLSVSVEQNDGTLTVKVSLANGRK